MLPYTVRRRYQPFNLCLLLHLCHKYCVVGHKICNKKPTRYHLVFYLFFLCKLLNMFRAILCPSSGADELVVARRLQPATRIPPQPAAPKLQHTSKQEHATNVVIQYKSRKLLMMDVLMSETC